MKLNCFTLVSLVFNIIPQHPNALVSFRQFYECHKHWHHITSMLISLHVIQPSECSCSYYDKSVDSCCYCAAYNWHGQTNRLCTVGTRLQWLWAAGNTQYICQLHTPSIYLPLSSTSKSLAMLVMTYSTFATSCFRKMLWVNLRGWGGSNIAVISWFWNLKKGVFSERPKCLKTLTLLFPLSHVVTTSSPALRLASRTSIKKSTSISPLAPPTVK